VIEPEPAAVAVLTEAAPKKKRGRPPERGVAMSAAERKVRSRARKKQNQEDQERRNLVAKLMRIYNRQQLTVDRKKKLAYISYEERLAVAHKHKRDYLGHISRLSFLELTDTLAAYQGTGIKDPITGKRDKGIKDTTGRQSCESPVGKASKLEHMAGKQAIAHVNMAPSLADEGSLHQSIKVLDSLNSQVKPTGVDPTSYEAGEERGSGTARPRELTTEETVLQMAIHTFISQMRRGSDGRTKCPCCNQTFSVEQAAENHLFEKYRTGEKAFTKSADIAEAIEECIEASGGLPPGIVIPPVTKVPQCHFNRLSFEIRIIRAQVNKFARRGKISSFDTAVDRYFGVNFVTSAEFGVFLSYPTQIKEDSAVS
jgi:hypothetical protein